MLFITQKFVREKEGDRERRDLDRDGKKRHIHKAGGRETVQENSTLVERERERKTLEEDSTLVRNVVNKD